MCDEAVGGVQQLQVERAEHADRGEVDEVPGAGEELWDVVSAEVVARAVEVEGGQAALAAVGANRRRHVREKGGGGAGGDD